MTREEIEKMPAGREMDLFVAAFVFETCGAWYKVKILDGVNEPREWVPCYSTDIAAAWKVVEKIAGVDSELSAHITGEYAGWGWRCVFGNAFVDYDVTAKTAPLAICRAALLAVMEAK